MQLWIVEDYGDVRPHGSLNGLAPMEAYKDPSKDTDFRKRILEARAERIEENRKVNCRGCENDDQ